MTRISVASAIRMIIAAVISLALNLVITTALHQWLLLTEEVSFFIALVTVTLTNFFLSRHYVFKASEGEVFSQLAKFITSIAGFRVFEYGAYLGLHTILGIQYQIAIFLVLSMSFLLKFIFFGLFVFGKQSVKLK